MILLVGFAFLAGIVTILSPCILPVLPIVLSGAVGEGRRRPIGIIAGFVLSFTFFTLFLSFIVKATGISADALRTLAVIVVFFFGLTLIVPQLQAIIEHAFSRLASIAPQTAQSSGFWGGVMVGLSLGLVWTPCVGPILASVISLSFTGSVSSNTVFITLAYAIGTSLPMLAIAYGGRALLQKVPGLLANTGKIQKIFGVLLIITAIAIQFNFDRKFQTFILEKFPNYGTGLTVFEQNERVLEQIKRLQPQNETRTDENSAAGEKKSTAAGEASSTSGFPSAPELIPGGKWFNSAPLKIKNLRGKVVLVDFWTYTCINCIRTLPYLKSWHEKYADKGLVIIGVHTPEFEFEKNPENVEDAIQDFGLKYPIVQDNFYETWRAYKNNAWPAKYFIDKDGFIRAFHRGEGAYDESEQLIQKLLAEAGSSAADMPISNPKYSIETTTRELYLGYDRIEYLVSPEKISKDKYTSYTVPTEIPPDTFAYGGYWTLNGERAIPQKDASLVLNFGAKEVFLVMRPKSGEKFLSGSSAPLVRVLLDGKPISAEIYGDDVKNGFVSVDSDRLYKLVKLGVFERHVLTLEFVNDTVELYAFTFG